MRRFARQFAQNVMLLLALVLGVAFPMLGLTLAAVLAVGFLGCRRCRW